MCYTGAAARVVCPLRAKRGGEAFQRRSQKAAFLRPERAALRVHSASETGDSQHMLSLVLEDYQAWS
jgi:hypothetical protein